MMSPHFYHSSNLAWSVSKRDAQRLKNIFLTITLLVLLFSLIIPWIPVPEKKDNRAKAAPLPPRYAKFIFKDKKPEPEIKKIKAKPIKKPKIKPKSKPKKKVKPKVVKKVNKKPKPIKKAKPKPKPKPKPKKTAAQLKAEAKAKVQKRFGSLFRKTLPVAPAMVNKKLNKASVASSSRPASSILTTEAISTSTGIDNIQIAEYAAAETELNELELTAVESSIDANLAQDYGNRGEQENKRSHNSIRQVFDRQKGRQLYPLYQRFLRKDPSLKGTIILRITIDPAGNVLACDVVSNELNNAQLAKRLIARVKKFDFGAQDVLETTVNYPMEFTPPN